MYANSITVGVLFSIERKEREGEQPVSEYHELLEKVDRLTDESERIKQRVTALKSDLSVLSHLADEILHDYEDKSLMPDYIHNRMFPVQEDGSHLAETTPSVLVESARRIKTKMSIEKIAEEISTCFFAWQKTTVDLVNAHRQLTAHKKQQAGG